MSRHGTKAGGAYCMCLARVDPIACHLERSATSKIDEIDPSVGQYSKSQLGLEG